MSDCGWSREAIFAGGRWLWLVKVVVGSKVHETMQFLNHCIVLNISGQTAHQWLFQISMKLSWAKIELGPIYKNIYYIK